MSEFGLFSVVNFFFENNMLYLPEFLLSCLGRRCRDWNPSYTYDHRCLRTGPTNPLPPAHTLKYMYLDPRDFTHSFSLNCPFMTYLSTNLYTFIAQNYLIFFLKKIISPLYMTSSNIIYIEVCDFFPKCLF